MRRDITMDESTALAITEAQGLDMILVADEIARIMCKEKLTLLQAEAVLVRAWGTMLEHCVLTYPSG